MKYSKPESSSEVDNVTTIIEEISRLIQRAMEVIGRDRVEFSHMLLGTNLGEESKKIEKALALFEKIPNTNPEKPILANKFGVILNALRLPSKAEQYFRRALVLLPGSSRPERAFIESNLFHAYINKGNFDAALSYMMQALEGENDECNLFDVERYSPEKILGVGGMGVTFLCRDNYEERQVVVKTLWRNVTGTLKEVFSEAFTAKKIDDPRVLRFYDIRRHRGNRPFIVMEYFAGVDLQKYVIEEHQGNPLALEEALSITKEVASALNVVHNSLDNPIIHRDIKPNNILYDPNTGQIKIIDFGIACMLPGIDEINRTIEYKTTSHHSIIAKNIAGTWGYMAPELQGGEQKLDPRVDIFSLGKTFMFLLTGKTPPPENIFALSKEMRELVGEFVGYCLMPQPEDRYDAKTVVEVIEQIQRKLDSPQEELEAINLDHGNSEILEDDTNQEEVVMATEVPDYNSDDAFESDVFSQENFDEPIEEANFDSKSSGDSPEEEDPSPLDAEEDEEELDYLDSVVISADEQLERDEDSSQEEEDSEMDFAQSTVISAEDESEQEAPKQKEEEEFSSEGLDITKLAFEGAPEEIAAQREIADEELKIDQPDALVIDPQEQEEEEEMVPEEVAAEEIPPEIEASSGPGEIMVRDEEADEECSLKPTKPFEKIELPIGYIWEGDMIICEKDGATMVHVPEGAFYMGYEGEGALPAEGPVHEVILGGYLIDECPVTWYQYNHFCEETGHRKPPSVSWELDESQPVVNITWEDAEAYAQWAGKQLPTEAQWEKAGRGGIFFDGDTMTLQRNQSPKRLYPWGDCSPREEGVERCNYRREANYGAWSPSPVGTFIEGASPYGCLDMSGNVWEWCLDWYAENYYNTSAASNPRGPRGGEGRVIRGGAFNSDQPQVRVTFRAYMEPEEYWSVIGFRTVKIL